MAWRVAAGENIMKNVFTEKCENVSHNKNLAARVSFMTGFVLGSVWAESGAGRRHTQLSHLHREQSICKLQINTVFP